MSFLIGLSAQLASWFFGIVISLLGIAFLYMLGQTGVSIRRERLRQ